MKISLLGLTGSGKTCYLYTAAHVLAKGVNVNGHTISANATNRQQAIRLNRGIETMAEGYWPEGSLDTKTYPFELKIDGQNLFPFTIYDYRGSMLDGLTDLDQEETEEIFSTFEESSCVVILIDGNTILEALEPDKLSLEHRKNISLADQLKARNKINYVEVLIDECFERMGNNVPVLLVITKRDLFYPEELKAGKDLLKQLLPSLFSQRNDMIAGITTVTLGVDLQNDGNRLTGTLCLNTSGNIHLPILFALFQNLEEIDTIDTTEISKLIRQLFSTSVDFSGKVISFYRGGKEAVIL